jgi:arylsulfatase A-like enzyme
VLSSTGLLSIERRVDMKRGLFASKRLVFIAVLALIVIPFPAAQQNRDGAAAATVGAPNVLVIVTDDQRAGTMFVMPKTLQWLRTGGVDFRQAYVPTPSCCPSRASIFSGRYVHNHSVLRQRLGASLDHRSTVQRQLKEGGYFTAMAGKFLNFWNLGTRPPYFDRYAVTTYGYYDTKWGIDGVVQSVSTYSTTFIGDKAIEYLSAFEQADDARPWFLYLATTAPHKPRTPEPQYAGATFGSWAGNPAVNEDVSDKPAYVRSRQPVGGSTIQRIRTEQLRTLKSVDDMVDRVLRSVQAKGELDNTLVIYLSDNGYIWGEHRFADTKFVPYSESVRVPFFARWPGHLTAGKIDNRLVASIDIKPTVLAAAGIAADAAYPMDGRSVLSAGGRSRLFTEYFYDDYNSSVMQSWAATRTRTYQYIENYDQPELNGGTFREYYDLVNDPWMLTNLYRDGNPSNDPPIGPLSSTLAADRNCSGTACP